MASTTASFATTMGTVPVGPVSVRTRTPDTTVQLRCVSACLACYARQALYS